MPPGVARKISPAGPPPDGVSSRSARLGRVARARVRRSRGALAKGGSAHTRRSKQWFRTSGTGPGAQARRSTRWTPSPGPITTWLESIDRPNAGTRDTPAPRATSDLSADRVASMLVRGVSSARCQCRKGLVVVVRRDPLRRHDEGPERGLLAFAQRLNRRRRLLPDSVAAFWILGGDLVEKHRDRTGRLTGVGPAQV